MFPRANARLAAAGALATLLLAGCAPSRDEQVAEHRATVQRYCVGCHDDAERTADLSLQSLPLGEPAAHAAEWEKVIRKLRAGMMPPVGEPRPTSDARLALASWLEGELDAAAAAAPNPGRTEPFHRLNRAEYRNAIRDLLDLDVDVAELLPADEASYGFDNIAGVLKLSPTLLERYLAAADKVSRLAVGTPSQFASIDWFRVPDDRSQERRLPGLPFGTRGGTLVDYHFPADAEYEIAVELARDLNEQVPLYAEAQELEIAIDGERVALFTLPAVPLSTPQQANNDPNAPAISQIVQRFSLSREERAQRNRADADWRVRVPVKAGAHAVTATFIARTAALEETARLPFDRPYPAGVNIPETRTGAYLRALEISGPYTAIGAGDTASRRRIFSCRPPAGDAATAEACAREILSSLARRAYRRPVASADLEPLLAFYREGAAQGFDAGVQLAVKRLLVSPEFLFRVERDPADVPPGALYPVGDLTLASRLSFFLWSSIPDDELLISAERGELRDGAALERQVRRMLADPRSDAFVENFAGQWLYLRNLDAVVPVQSVFPDFDDTLRQGLKRETELFFGSVVHEDRSALDLLRADYTFVNERVARLYGIPNVKGNHFRRVTLPTDAPRRGLLGHGSILTVTSYPDRTSPVVRGKWILENLLGVPPPPPPPNVPELEETSDGGGTLSIRERLAAHRENPSCASCHALMDPLGFALENFDAVGVWRTIDDTGRAVDASGTLPDGTPFTGVEEFRAALESSDLFVMTLTEKLLTYALGRGVEHYDQPAVRAIVRAAAADDYRFSALITNIVQSTPFTLRRSGS
jgi:mono/diheme cytochrome c family protein